MKVYVKKEDKNTTIPGIIVMIIFLLFSVATFTAIIFLLKDGKSFVDILASSGSIIIFALIFFGFSMFFIYSLVKRPKGYKVKLVNKKVQKYKGNQITYMEFRTQKENEKDDDFISSKYKCYTIGDNNLIVDNDYSLKIKEFNWEPKCVEEISDSYVNRKNKVTEKTPKMNIPLVPISIGALFVGMLFLCILGIITYPEYTSTYIMTGIFSTLFLFALIMCFKTPEKDSKKLNHDSINLELGKVEPLENKQEKVGNILIKYKLILLIVFPIISFLIMIKMNLDIEEIIGVFIMILFLELMIIIKNLCNLVCDNRLIRKHKINITEDINISNIHHFNIFKSSNTSYPQYFVVDQNRNLILKIKRGNFIGNKYIICNQNDIKMGEIKSKLFCLTDKYIVNIMNESPFIICSKNVGNSNYQIIGRDFYVKGNTNIIYDSNKNEIAHIYATSKTNNWYKLGNKEVVLKNNIDNSVDIIIIALCVTM